MREIEIKFRARDLKAVRAKLIHLGAKLDWKGDEETWFFDTPKNHLKRKRYNLRLRKWAGHSNRLTLKTKPAEEDDRYKVRDEYEIEISDIKTAAKILTCLGFHEHLRYRKHREHWKLSDAAVELDTLSGLYFVEIEAPKKRIDELAHFLDLSWKDAVKKGYVGILKDLQRRGDGHRSRA